MANTLKDKKILVTGANGFVGRTLCEELLLKQFNVRAIVRSPQKQNIFLNQFPTSECYVQENFLETNWMRSLENVDTIIHLASRVHVMKESHENPLAEYRKINVEGTKQLARVAIKAGIRRFIYLSSVKVNGEMTLPNEKFTESDIPNPEDFYAQSKWEAEEALRKISNGTNLETVIIRSPLIYGNGVKANFQKLLKMVQRGVPLPFGAINNKRSLIYVKNLTSAIITCISHENAKGQTYLVSDNDDVSTPELIKKLATTFHKRPRLISIKPSILETLGKITKKETSVQRLLSSLVINSDKIRNELQWMPAYSIQQALDHSFGKIA